MGANPKQAMGILVFLVAFVLIAAAAALGSILLGLLGVAVLAASIAIFLKAKPLEYIEE